MSAMNDLTAVLERFPQPYELRGKSKAYVMPHPDVDPNNPDDEGFVPVSNYGSGFTERPYRVASRGMDFRTYLMEENAL